MLISKNIMMSNKTNIGIGLVAAILVVTYLGLEQNQQKMNQLRPLFNHPQSKLLIHSFQNNMTHSTKPQSRVKTAKIKRVYVLFKKLMKAS